MTTSGKLEQGQEAFRRQSWGDAYALLSSADNDTSLVAEDLELLAKAAYLIGKESECIDFWSRAHQKFLDQQQTEAASNSAFWIGMVLFNQGEHAQGGGWIARAGRLIDDYGQDCPECGFLLIPRALQHLRNGEAGTARELFARAVETGKRYNNRDLITLGLLGSGQALIRQNNIGEGTTLLDEAMVAVVSEEISPIVAGIVYCAVIDTCQKIYDLQRAREWTEALSRWCDSQPDLIPYRGQCLVRRAEIMQIHGEWPDAMNEIRQACDLSGRSTPPAGGEAHYLQAELHRLQGNFTKAEETYRQARKWGRNPQPGLALLRLEQGQIQAAETAIRQAEDEQQDRLRRSKILPAYVEIMLAADQPEAAERAAAELAEIASDIGAPLLSAIAERTLGRVELATAGAGTALKRLRTSWALLKQIEATYEAAVTQALIGMACRKAGDTDSAEMEFEAARKVFEHVGAAPDLRRVESLMKQSTAENPHGLTPRELEVLRILATGKTNKAIGEELFISERTVDRHVSNILGKLDVKSRAAATAYAYKHHLI